MHRCQTRTFVNVQITATHTIELDHCAAKRKQVGGRLPPTLTAMQLSRFHHQHPEHIGNQLRAVTLMATATKLIIQEKIAQSDPAEGKQIHEHPATLFISQSTHIKHVLSFWPTRRLASYPTQTCTPRCRFPGAPDRRA